VSAEYSADTPIEIPTHGDFFGSGFGVEIDDDRQMSFGKLGQELVNSAEGTIVVTDKGSAHQVDDDSFFSNDKTTSGCPRRIVQRAKDRQRAVEMGDDFLLCPDVVAGSDDINPGGDKFLSRFRGNAGSVSGVFAVTNNEVKQVIDAQAWQELLDGFPAGLADNITYNQGPQEGLP